MFLHAWQISDFSIQHFWSHWISAILDFFPETDLKLFWNKLVWNLEFFLVFQMFSRIWGCYLFRIKRLKVSILLLQFHNFQFQIVFSFISRKIDSLSSAQMISKLFRLFKWLNACDSSFVVFQNHKLVWKKMLELVEYCVCPQKLKSEKSTS